MYIYHIFLIWSSVNGHLGCFHVLDIVNRLVVAKGEGEGVGWIGSLGLIDADCLLWNGLISNEILLCSTGNYV